ncbi:MAG: hypothetical protein RI883_1269 [Bacteroidota bacterium]|jgi:hypothetical protein
MKNRTLSLILLGSIFIIANTNLGYSQREIKSLNPPKSSISNQNNSELHSKTIAFSNEVYRDCPEYTTTDFLKEYSSQIFQVDIIKAPSTEGLTFPSLSTIPLRNKCNPDLIGEDENFDSANFNPLKYMFNYYTYTDQYFLVDNTNYVIHIAIKH